MGRRGRPEVLALQLPQGPEQLTVTNLGPASKLLQEGGQERVALQHIQRVCGSDHLPLLRIRELEGQGRVPRRLGGWALKPDSRSVFNRLGRRVSTRKLVNFSTSGISNRSVKSPPFGFFGAADQIDGHRQKGLSNPQVPGWLKMGKSNELSSDDGLRNLARARPRLRSRPLLASSA